jgi:hypothetical protein
VWKLTLTTTVDTLRAQSGSTHVSGLAATVKMYQRVASRAASLAVRNWPVLLSALAYAAIMFVATLILGILASLGMGVMFLAGFAMSLVSAACAASFLYLVEMIVRTNRVTLADFQRSFGVYLWDVVGVAFVLWIVGRLLVPVLASLPQATLLLTALYVLVLVFGNAVPELIYLGHHSTLALLQESYKFVGENWIEWFPPNLLLFGVLIALNIPVLTGPAYIVQQAITALFVYFAMVFRGLLFLELYGTSRRGRMFRYRMEG